MTFNRKKKKKRIIFLFTFLIVIFCSATVLNAFTSDATYAEDTLLSFVWPTNSPKPTPTPTKKPTPSPKPTNSPVPPSASPTPTPTPTATATEEPTPSPTPERPTLPNVAVPGLDFPPTPTPAGTIDPNATLDPEVTPSPSPTPEPTPEPEEKPTWSGFLDFITKVCYVAAGLTAIYALLFFLICVLFKKEPTRGFGFSKKKKKKKKKNPQKEINAEPKKKKVIPEEAPSEEKPAVKSEFNEEASAYFSTGGTFVRYSEEEGEDRQEASESSEVQSETPAENIDFTESDIPIEPGEKEEANSLEETKELSPVQESLPEATEETEFSGEIAAESEILSDIADIAEFEEAEEEMPLLNKQGEEDVEEIDLTPPQKPKTLTFIRAAAMDPPEEDTEER